MKKWSGTYRLLESSEEYKGGGSPDFVLDSVARGAPTPRSLSTLLQISAADDCRREKSLDVTSSTRGICRFALPYARVLKEYAGAPATRPQAPRVGPSPILG